MGFLDKDFVFECMEYGEKTLRYKLAGNDPRFVVNTAASCGCTKPVWNQATKTLTVKFTAGSIPKHLQEEGMGYSTSKTITAFFNDGTSETLGFTAKVKPR